MSSKSTTPYTPLIDEDASHVSTKKLAQISAEIDKTKTQMLHNIDATLQRGEAFEHLENKTENMKQQAVIFKKTAADVKSHFCWQYYKVWG